MKLIKLRKRKKDNYKNVNNILDLRSIIRTKNKVRWSEEIDNTLYGKEE